MNELRHIDHELTQAAEIIKNGGVVAIPTETVYGLAANALDVNAVSRIFAIKNRPFFDPLIVHVASIDQAEACCSQFPKTAVRLARAFWPGSLTMILPKAAHIPELVSSGLPTVAVRMPDHPIALELIRRCGVPLAAPSANPFGALSPTCAEHVKKHLGDKVDAIIDGGPCRVGVESTIISLIGTRPAVLRPGGIPIEKIEELTGPIPSGESAREKPDAPGQLPSHYAPRTPLFLDALPPRHKYQRLGLLTFCAVRDTREYTAIEALSHNCDIREAAAGLFAALHRLDALKLDAIVARTFPPEGLGVAINDRLRRAAHKTQSSEQ